MMFTFLILCVGKKPPRKNNENLFKQKLIPIIFVVNLFVEIWVWLKICWGKVIHFYFYKRVFPNKICVNL